MIAEPGRGAISNRLTRSSSGHTCASATLPGKVVRTLLATMLAISLVPALAFGEGNASDADASSITPSSAEPMSEGAPDAMEDASAQDAGAQDAAQGEASVDAADGVDASGGIEDEHGSISGNGSHGGKGAQSQAAEEADSGDAEQAGIEGPPSNVEDDAGSSEFAEQPAGAEAAESDEARSENADDNTQATSDAQAADAAKATGAEKADDAAKEGDAAKAPAVRTRTAPVMAKMAMNEPKEAELRPGKNKTGSTVPGQTIIMDDGGRLPLVNASVSGTVAGLEKRKRPSYSDSSGLIDAYAVWINNVKLEASKGYKATIPGTITLKWANTAADIAGRRLDLTLTISEIEVKSNNPTQQKSKRIRVVSSANHEEGTGFLELQSWMQAVNGSDGGRLGIRYRVDAKFTYTGTNTVASGKYLFCVTDLDQPDKSMQPADDKNYSGRYRESVQLISGFEKQFFKQKKVTDHYADNGSSMLKYQTGSGTIWGTEVNDYPDNFRQGFVVPTTGGQFSFYWAGSHASTRVLSSYEDVRIRDRNVSVSGAGIISKTVNEYGQAIGSAASTKRTSGAWRSTRMPWKGTATYYFGAKEGYRVTNVNLIYDEWNGQRWVRTNHYKGAISSYTFKSSEMDRDYDIELSTVAVPAVSTVIRASKVLSGRTLAAGEFEFQLKENGKVVGTARNDAAGNVSFTTPRYTYPSGLGKHTYTVTELKGDLRSVTYDAHVLTAVVNVGFNASTNAMSASVSYSGATTFTNKFMRRGGVKVRKVDAATGRPLGNAVFGVYDSSGNLVKRMTTNRHGIASLASTELSADDKAYTVREIEAPKGYVLNDEMRTFILTTDGQVADLTGDPFADEPNPAVVAIKARKVLKGRAPAAGEFTFVLMKDGELVETAKNGADQYATFSEMEFDLSDAGRQIRYEVHEIAGDDEQIRYDDHYWTVDIQVVADNGRVTASTNYTRHDETEETRAALPTMEELSAGRSGTARTPTRQVLENPQFILEAVIDDATVSEAISAKDAASGFFDGLDGRDEIEILPRTGFAPSFVEKAYAATAEAVDPNKVAVIDTASACADAHGHGSAMADAVQSQNPGADIALIRAFDGNGQATPERVAEAIREAVEDGAGVVNLSFAKFDDTADDCVEQAVRDALGCGVTVVAAAGCGGYDARDFTPANIDGVVTVGALDADGQASIDSNVGECVDVFVAAGSTSEAAAKASGWLSANGGNVEALVKGDGLPFEAKAGIRYVEFVDDGQERYAELPLTDVPDELKSALFDVSESTVEGAAGTFKGTDGGTKRFRALLGYTVSTDNDTTKSVTLNGYLKKNADFTGPGSNWKYKLSGEGQTAVAGTGSGTIATSTTKYKLYGSKTWSWTKGTAATTKDVVWKVYRASNSSQSSSVTLTVNVGAKTHHLVKYAPNGGTSTPDQQTKWYGTNITLRPKIAHNNTTATGYTVTYSGNGGTPARASDTSTKTTKYTFSKWKSSYDSKTYDAGASYGVDAGKDVTMTAQWSTSTTNGAVTLPSASRTGYTFGGWKTSGGAGPYASGSSYTPTAATTLVAQWSGVWYYVAYNANGGTLPSGKNMGNTSHQYGSSSNLRSNDYVKAGYTFMGWAASQADANAGTVRYGNQAAVSNLTTVSGGTVTLYAVWKKNVTVAFNGNGAAGSTQAVSGYYYHQNTSTSLKLASETFVDPAGYTFAGWAESLAQAQAGNAKYGAGATIAVSDNMTLYAVWKRTVTFKSGVDCATVRTANQFYPSAVTVPSGNAQIAGWTFAGWREDNVAGTAQHAATGAVRPAATTVYAVYTTDLVTAYSANGGEFDQGADYVQRTPATYNAADTLASNVKVSDVPKPTRDGEDYLCWSTANDGSGTTLFAGDSIVDLYAPEWTSVTLYAIWEGNEATFRNEFFPKSGLTLKKIDTETGKPVPGARFAIEEVEGTSPGNVSPMPTMYVTTDGNGVATTGNAALWGGATYRVREVEAPAGYVLSDTVREFTAIAEQGAVYDAGEWGNEPAKTTAKIALKSVFKTVTGHDSAEARTIDPGEFVFDLYDGSGNVVATVRTASAASGELDLEFPEMRFGYADVGEPHAYTIRQRDLGEAGVTYDLRDIDVAIGVTWADGSVTAQVAYSNEGAPLDAAVYENTYTPSYDLAAFKASAAHPSSGAYDVEGIAPAMAEELHADNVTIADMAELAAAGPGCSVGFTATVTCSRVVAAPPTLNVEGIASSLTEHFGDVVELEDEGALRTALALADSGDPILFAIRRAGEQITLTAARDDGMNIFAIEAGEVIAKVPAIGGGQDTVVDERVQAFTARFDPDGSIHVADEDGVDAGDVAARQDFTPATASVPLPGAEITVFEIEGGLPADDEVALPPVFSSAREFESRFALNEAKQAYEYDADGLARECGLRVLATVRTAADGFAMTEGGQLSSGKAYAVIETKAPAGYLLRQAPVVYIVDDFADNGEFSHVDYVNGAEAVVRHLDAAGNPDAETGKEARRAYRYEIGADGRNPSLADIDFENEPNGVEAGGVRVAKVDGETDAPLAGAWFDVYDALEFDAAYARWRADTGYADAEGTAIPSSAFMSAMRHDGEDDSPSPYSIEPVASMESGQDGFAETTACALVVGRDYRVVETEAPDGYDLPVYNFENPNSQTAGNWTFTVEAAGAIQQRATNGDTMVFHDSRSEKAGVARIVAHKVLLGAELVEGQFAFALYDEGGDEVAQAVNDAEGVVAFEIPYDGSQRGIHRYRLLEKSSGDPGMVYDSHEAVVTVDVSDGGGADLSCQVSAEDERDLVYYNEQEDAGGVLGSVRAIKLDADSDAPVAGARFRLEGDNGYLCYLESGEDGIAATPAKSLPAGGYTMREVEAPEGYKLNTEWSASFTVEEDGQEVDLTGDPCRDEADRLVALPLTGGPGTWALAALLAAFAAGFLMAFGRHSPRRMR